MRIRVPQNNKGKFRQVLLYILKVVGSKPNIGQTALYKLLYFIDFDYYEKYEEQLMGLEYLKNQYGPTPRLFKPVMEDMIRAGQVVKVTSQFYHYPQTKYLPVVEPDLSLLTAPEKDHIDRVIARLADMTGAQLSDLSHRDVPWITAKWREPIDYEAVFYRTHDTSVRHYDEADGD